VRVEPARPGVSIVSLTGELDLSTIPSTSNVEEPRFAAEIFKLA
jgi:hypothetical protein